MSGPSSPPHPVGLYRLGVRCSSDQSSFLVPRSLLTGARSTRKVAVSAVARRAARERLVLTLEIEMSLLQARLSYERGFVSWMIIQLSFACTTRLAHKPNNEHAHTRARAHTLSLRPLRAGEQEPYSAARALRAWNCPSYLHSPCALHSDSDPLLHMLRFLYRCGSQALISSHPPMLYGHRSDFCIRYQQRWLAQSGNHAAIKPI